MKKPLQHWEDPVSDAIFLTDEEVCQLTGIRRGNGKKNYRELQVEWMIRRGYPARLNAAGRAIVVRSVIEGTRKIIEPPSKEWTSHAWR